MSSRAGARLRDQGLGSLHFRKDVLGPLVKARPLSVRLWRRVVRFSSFTLRLCSSAFTCLRAEWTDPCLRGGEIDPSSTV
jgi:hypothetical protein